MTSILVVTADDALRAALTECAGRAGVFLTVHEDIAGARPVWSDAELVLLGADRLPAAARARLRARTRLIVVAGPGMDTGTIVDAEAVQAAYLAVMPAALDWLVEQLRPHGDATIGRLRAAGFTVGFTDRARAADNGFVYPLDWRERPDEGRQDPYVMLSEVARGDCTAGQSTSVQRSNMRALHRAFPGVFTDLVFSNVTVLGAFVADLPPGVVQVLCRLAQVYAVFDEDDLSVLEHDEVIASWAQWVAADVYHGLGERARTVWDCLDDTDRESLWWDVVAGVDGWPEHDARTVLWRLNRLVGAYAARLTAEARRRARTSRTRTSPTEAAV